MLGTFVDVNDCPDGHIEIKNHVLNLLKKSLSATVKFACFILQSSHLLGSVIQKLEVENTCLIPCVGHSLTSVIVLKDASRWKTCCDPMLRAFVDVRSAIAMCLRYA